MTAHPQNLRISPSGFFCAKPTINFSFNFLWYQKTNQSKSFETTHQLSHICRVIPAGYCWSNNSLFLFFLICRFWPGRPSFYLSWSLPFYIIIIIVFSFPALVTPASYFCLLHRVKSSYLSLLVTGVNAAKHSLLLYFSLFIPSLLYLNFFQNGWSGLLILTASFIINILSSHILDLKQLHSSFFFISSFLFSFMNSPFLAILCYAMLRAPLPSRLLLLFPPPFRLKKRSIPAFLVVHIFFSIYLSIYLPLIWPSRICAFTATRTESTPRKTQPLPSRVEKINKKKIKINDEETKRVVCHLLDFLSNWLFALHCTILAINILHFTADKTEHEEETKERKWILTRDPVRRGIATTISTLLTAVGHPVCLSLFSSTRHIIAFPSNFAN